jgi:hypothetical protein
MSRAWLELGPDTGNAWEAALAEVRADDTYPVPPPWTDHLAPLIRVAAAAAALVVAIAGLHRKGP